MTTVAQNPPKPILLMHTRVTYLANEQETRPAGVRIVEPPPDTRQALRGNLYAIVELTGDNPEREPFTERLLSVIQRTYYTVKGSQSRVLTDALREAERSVEAFNAQNEATPIKAGMIIAALLGSRLTIVSNGQGLALITAGSNVDVYPPYTAGNPTEPAVPEGSWELYHQELTGGGALFIGGRSWLHYLPLRELASTVAYLTEENCVDAATELLAQSKQPAMPGLLILMKPSFVSPTNSALPPALRRPRLSALPTALNASPPVQGVPLASAAPAEHPVNAMPVSLSTPSATPVDGEVATARPSATSILTGLIAGVAAGTKSAFQRARTFFTNLLPDHQAASTGADGALRSVHLPTHRLATEAAPAMPPAVGAGATVGNQPFNPAPPITMPPRTGGGRLRLFLLLALLLAVLAPLTVAVVQWQQGATNRADAEALLDLAEARLASAQEAFDAGDRVNARSLLGEAQSNVDLARQILVSRSPRADALAVNIQHELVEVLQIQPLYGLAQPLVRFPADAQPKRILVVDQDIYVLDVGRQLVQHFRLDPATNTVPDQEGDVILRQGDRIRDVEVGRLVAFAWQLPIPGIEDKPTLLVLDRNNNLFQYDQRVEGVTPIVFGEARPWVAPVLLQVYLGRLYVLDEGANQIFRHNPGDYNQPPEGWFSAQTPVNLGGVQAMAIDGDIWLLFGDGAVLRYQQGRQVPFALENSIPLSGATVDMAIGDQTNSLIYLADSAEERILVFDKQGAYQRQLQAAEGNPLAGLSALYVDEAAGVLYILTQSALYQHALPN